MAEHQPSKLRVAGSNPVSRSKKDATRHPAERSVAASAFTRFRDANREVEKRCPERRDGRGRPETPAREVVSRAWFRDAHVAQSVAHVLGKDGVTGSIPVVGSTPYGIRR